MKEKVILAKIIKILLEDGNLLQVKELSKQIILSRNDFAFIDWDFLDDVENKSKEEIKNWLNYFLNNMYI